MTEAGAVERELMRQSLRGLLDHVSPEAHVRRSMDAADGFDAETWTALAGQLELPGLIVPAAYGGQGFGWAELAVVFEELGRALAVVPYLATTLAVAALQAGDDDDARERWLPGIATGAVRATVLLPARADDAVTARPTSDGVMLSGRRSHGIDALAAHLLIVPAEGPDGPGVYLVEAGDGRDGLTRSPVPTLDQTRSQADVQFDECPARRLRTRDARALVAAVEAAAAVALACEQVGGALRCEESAVDYARTRMQFGRPIGSFQALRHRCTDMLLHVVAARSLALDAADAVDRRGLGAPAVQARAHAAAAFCGDAFVRVAADNIQVHGGIGMTWEHSAHLFLKRAKSSQLLLGTPGRHRAALAALLRREPDALRPIVSSPPAAGAPSDDDARIKADLAIRVDRLLAEAPSIELEHGIPFRRAQFDAGLAWVGFPDGLGGLSLPSTFQPFVERLLLDHGIAPATLLNPIGYGNVAPVLAAHGTDEQRRRFLHNCFTTEDVWCQLMSEPGAGSDVAGLSTTARPDGSGGWLISGQKVWTSLAHIARWGLAVVRTDPDAPKHAGITCFIVDMQAVGVDIHPLRLLNGKADFNEVFLDNVAVPDAFRVGEPGQGWRVVRSNLESERAAFGAQGSEPDAGEDLLADWLRDGADDPVLDDRVMTAVIGSLAARLTTERAAHDSAVHPSIIKILSSESKQCALEVALDALGADGTSYAPDGYAMEQPTRVGIMQGDAAARYLRCQGLTIEGGTSAVMRNVLADSVLQLPREPRFDLGAPWREIPRTPEDYARRVSTG